MPEFSAMANRAPKNRDFRNRVFDRLERRTWPIAVSALFVLLQLLFLFRWGSVVEHIPKLWLCGQDFWITYLNSSQFVHGHFGAIYQAKLQFLEPPGILLALAPLGAFSGSFHSNLYQIVQGRAIPLPDIVVHVRGFNAPFIYPKEIFMHGGQYVLQTQWTEFVYPYVLALFCTVLFACDALAERMQVGRSRRATLCVVEAVLLWNLALSQHPEDAVAVALAVYALIFALDRRFVGAGWLFGAALAFQPLVILMMPVLMAMAGRKRMLGFVIRSVLPAAVLLAPSFIAAFSATFRALASSRTTPTRTTRRLGRPCHPTSEAKASTWQWPVVRVGWWPSSSPSSSASGWPGDALSAPSSSSSHVLWPLRCGPTRSLCWMPTIRGRR